MDKTPKTYRKSPSLKTKRDWIDLHFNKGVTVKSLADDYGYPVHTVYRVLAKMDPNRKERSDKGKKQKSPSIDVDFESLNLQGESYETQLEIMFEQFLRGIQAKKRISIDKAIYYGNRLTDMLKKLRSVQFRQMAKSLDVKIVERIIRRYDPDVTDLRIIEVVKEVIAEIKAENKQ